jgi:hypothetical protein
MDERSQYLSKQGCTERIQKIERLDIGNDRGRQEGRTRYTAGKAACVLEGDGRAGMVSDHVPLFYAMWNSKQFNLFVTPRDLRDDVRHGIQF